jgi:hypothetical protein
MTDRVSGTYDEFLEIAERQIPVTKEPKNGGASVSTFFAALGDVDEEYTPSISLSFREVLSR